MHEKFWLTIGSLYSLILIFVMILFIAAGSSIAIIRGFCLLNVPVILYLMIQFISNYYNLTEKKND